MEQNVSGNDFLIFRSGITNLYLLPHGDEYILVDAGMKKKEKAFVSFLTKQNIHPEKIRYIFLTHTHYDHTGALNLIREITHAEILLHASEAGYLRKGFTPAPRGTRVSTKIISFLGRRVFPGYSRYEPAEPDILWEESGYRPGDFPAELLHTPGHTEGSASLVWKEKAAFVGDTLFGYEKDDCLPWFANDLELLKKSWQRLLDTPSETFYPSHGQPVKRDLLEASFRKHFGEPAEKV
jgi:glyoxylase-like metal-dependent hydrolase (beta-lactamase superfamily II)